MATGDQSDFLFEGISLEDPSRRLLKPVHMMAIFYLTTIFQYRETLPDHLAADALRERIDWQYALHLPLHYPGLTAASLCEFRQWLLVQPLGKQNLQALLARLSEVTNFCKDVARLDSNEVILAVCGFSRLAKIWVVFNQALESLAIRRPDWLLEVSRPHWYERYGAQKRNLDLGVSDDERQALAQAIGADGKHLLQAVAQAADPELPNLSEVVALRQVWNEQFECVEGKLAWREEICAGCSLPGSRSHLSSYRKQDKS